MGFTNFAVACLAFVNCDLSAAAPGSSTAFVRVPGSYVGRRASVRSQVQASLDRPAVSRRDMLAGAVLLASSPLLTSCPAQAEEVFTLPSGVSYTVLTTGKGPQPVRGDLCAIRFKGGYGDVVIDDIFSTPEPYFYRVGSDVMIKGVQEVVPMMHVGDIWRINIPSDSAFGPKGRKASAGTARIPGGQDVVYEVKLELLPGKEEEILELSDVSGEPTVEQ